MPSLPQRIADLVIARRALILVALLAVGGLSVAGALGVEADFTPEELFTADDAQKRATDEFRATFGNTDNVLVALIEAEDVLAPAPLEYQRSLSDYLADRPYADEVTSLTRTTVPRRTGEPRALEDDVSVASIMADIASGRLEIERAASGEITGETTRELARGLEQMPLVWGQLISRDRSVSVVALLIDPARERVDELEEVVSDVEAWLAANPPPDGVDVHLGGLPFIRVDVVRSLEADQTMLFPAAFAVIFGLLLLTFRWPPAVALPLLAVGLSASILMGLMGLVGEPLNIINNVIPILVIIIGITDSIHLVNRYGEELIASGDRREAARRSLRSMIVALFLTSFTTAVGFASLMVSHLPVLGRFGVTAAAGVLVAYLVTITLLPGGLSLAPQPRRPIADPEHGWIERLVGPLVDCVLRHRAWVLIAGLLGLGAAAVTARGVTIDTAVHHQFEPGTRMWRTIEILETKLDGLRPVEIGLRGPDAMFHDPEAVRAIDDVTRWARAQDSVLSARSYADLLRQAWFVATGNARTRNASLPEREKLRTLAGFLDRAPGQLGQYVTPKRDRARISIRMADVGGVETVAFVRALRQTLDQTLPDDVSVIITGEGYVASAGLNTLTRDLLVGLLIAIGVIFGFMSLVLRSLRLGLLSIPPNALPLVATIAYLRIREIPLSPATVIIFSISIGLAVDGTIHILARFREELAAGLSRDQALRRAARGTGKAVVVSYASLIIGFTVFQLSAFVPVQQFGELISVTIAGCLVSTLLLLPAMISAMWPASPERSEE